MLRRSLVVILSISFALAALIKFTNGIEIASAASGPAVPDWVRYATVGGFDITSTSTDAAILSKILQRKQENVSVLEVDSKLSQYIRSETEFDAEVAFLDRVAKLAHSESMKAVIYYPSLEVITQNGETIAETMFKEHPDWVQYGIDGKPNVFYGSKEVWVDPQAESAWMSPNSGYRDYYLNRIRKLAATDLDGVWVDVPIYLETGAAWADAGTYAKAAFRDWAIANGHGALDTPTQVNWDDPVFRIWVRWRHENLADFTEAVRQAAHAVNPNFVVIIEVFPLDHTDATVAGLDGLYRKSANNFIRVWEVDSVSNTQAMKWASVEEFSNKIAMLKWGLAADRGNPSWSFSYGYEPLDAGLVIAATVATGNVPFESQTPQMILSIDSAFRERWFGFVRNHAQALFGAKRKARVGIWYSSPSRDYRDVRVGGGFGMYVTTTPPTTDPDWWSSVAGDSALPKPHLGGYRGMAHAMTKLAIPYQIVTDPGEDYAASLAELDMLLLPSVTAISDAAAAAIENFVANGGVVLATGELPGTMDELGNPRSTSAFATLFNFNPAGVVGGRANPYGKGMAFYNPDVRGANLFASVGDPVKAADNLSTVEQLVRIHAPDMVRVNGPEGVHVEVSQPTATTHYLYVVNYSGLQMPLKQNIANLSIQYQPPQDYRVVNAEAATPDLQGQSGSLAVTQEAKTFYGINVTVDQFALIKLTLAQETPAAAPAYTPPLFTTDRDVAVTENLAFVENFMRDVAAPIPYRYGIFTNYLNDEGLTDIFAHGHHVALEQIGVMLRTAACLGDEALYQELYTYIKDVMVAPDYQILNWAVDRDTRKPLISSTDTHWITSNAPLDDFRVIRGLLEGYTKLGRTDTVELAKRLLRGMYWTSVTDRQHGSLIDFPVYPEGLIGYAWDWQGTQNPSLNPPAYHTGIGGLFIDPIPVDYQDLATIGLAAELDSRWKGTLAASTDLLLNAEIPGSDGLFYNGYGVANTWTGDFENRDINQGKHLKTIQVLWTALHLAAASQLSPAVLDDVRRSEARLAAERTLTFFKSFYQLTNRIPEYLTFSGTDVPNCTGNNIPAGCLKHGDENLFSGEARIYALLGRLALLLGDKEFTSQLIDEKILTDRVTDVSDVRYGMIGVSTAGNGNAEIFNIGEPLLTICLETASSDDISANQPPYAYSQALNGTTGQPLNVTLKGSDIDGNALTFTVVDSPKHGSLSGAAPNLTYTPTSGYTGTDSFTFKVNDGQLDSNIATVNIDVQEVGAGNNPPIAYGDTVVTTAGIPVGVTLTAQDIDGDALTLEIATGPTHGSLSGTIPNLIYTPAPNFSGVDSFTFIAKDGIHSSKAGRINLTVNAAAGGSPTLSNQIADNAVRIDGDPLDWMNVHSFGNDPNEWVWQENERINWLEGWMAHDSQQFYVAYRNNGDIGPELIWGWSIFFDTDNNNATGYKIGAIGADYLIQGDVLKHYIGNGDTWTDADWIIQPGLRYAIRGDFVELSFPRSVFANNPASVRLIFIGDNGEWSKTTIDRYPDGAEQEGAKIRFFSYSTTTTLNCTDSDADGFSAEGGACGPIDCNDADPNRNPGATEICDDGIDNNCDGSVDAADVAACPVANTIGLYDPLASAFHLKRSNAGVSADMVYGYGPAGAGWLPLVGDWNNNSVHTAGLYDQRTGTFYLNNAHRGGKADLSFRYGPANAAWQPLIGDWNRDGTDTIGLYNPASGTFYLKDDNSAGVATRSFRFGPIDPELITLAGDWDGDGQDTVGLYHRRTGVFYLVNAHRGGKADLSLRYGPVNAGWQPLVGDWNGNGVDTIGLYRPDTSQFYLRQSNTPGVADLSVRYGPAGQSWQPLVGKWQ